MPVIKKLHRGYRWKFRTEISANGFVTTTLIEREYDDFSLQKEFIRTPEEMERELLKLKGIPLFPLPKVLSDLAREEEALLGKIEKMLPDKEGMLSEKRGKVKIDPRFEAGLRRIVQIESFLAVTRCYGRHDSYYGKEVAATIKPTYFGAALVD